MILLGYLLVTRINFSADNENYVEIELVASDIVQQWLEYFKSKYQFLNFRIGRRRTQYGLTAPVFQNTVQDNLSSWLHRIQAGLQYADQDLAIKIPDALRTVEEVIQLVDSLPSDQTGYFPIPIQYLNLWHRVFAECMMDLQPRLNKFELNQRDSESRKLVDDINNGVHHIEKFCTIKENTRRQRYAGADHFCVEFISSRDENILLADQEFGSGRQTIKFHYDHKKDDHWQYNVWLDEDISGKDMIRCWLDHDDMMQHQITGNLMMTPGIMFDPNRLINRVLDDPEFDEEYHSKNNHKTLDRVPLGKIISYSVTSNQFESISSITINEE
jgi:hypothetical protein